MDEYAAVVRRARLVRWHRLSEAEISEFLKDLAATATELNPARSPIPCPDPGDQHLWDLLVAEPEAVLVTGDRKLLESTDFPGRVLSPRDFVERYDV